MKKLFVIILISVFFNSAFGQDNQNTYSKWYLKPAAGQNIPITNLLSGEVTDDLFEYSDNSYYWQVISGNFFFSKNWGLELTYQAGNSSDISGRAARFNKIMQKMYTEDYFVSSSSGAEYDDFNPILGNIERGYLGIVYRIEKTKLILLPKLFIGVTSFYTDWGSADLKEKGTNTVIRISYNSGQRPNDHFTIAPAVTFGYRLSKRLIANIDLLYSYYKTNIEFIEETRNTFTEETSYKIIDYKKNIHTLTIGIGLTIELKSASNRL